MLQECKGDNTCLIKTRLESIWKYRMTWHTSCWIFAVHLQWLRKTCICNWDWGHKFLKSELKSIFLENECVQEPRRKINSWSISYFYLAYIPIIQCHKKHKFTEWGEGCMHGEWGLGGGGGALTLRYSAISPEALWISTINMDGATSKICIKLFGNCMKNGVLRKLTKKLYSDQNESAFLKTK